MQVFGPPWDAPVYEDSEHVPTPVGRPCLDCGNPIKKRDQGYLIPFMRGNGVVTIEAHHRLCFHQHVIPVTAMQIENFNTKTTWTGRFKELVRRTLKRRSKEN